MSMTDESFLIDLAREHLMSEHFAAVLARRISDKYGSDLIDYFASTWKLQLDKKAQEIVDKALQRTLSDQYLERQVRQQVNRLVKSEVVAELIRQAKDEL